MDSLYSVIESSDLEIAQDYENAYIMINADDAVFPLSLNYTFIAGCNCAIIILLERI
jgi:hypothetical protein